LTALFCCAIARFAKDVSIGNFFERRKSNSPILCIFLKEVTRVEREWKRVRMPIWALNTPEEEEEERERERCARGRERERESRENE
jgi:hypothetical protein